MRQEGRIFVQHLFSESIQLPLSHDLFKRHIFLQVIREVAYFIEENEFLLSGSPLVDFDIASFVNDIFCRVVSAIVSLRL